MARVRVLRRLEERGCGIVLLQQTLLHDIDIVGEAPHHSQIMRDEDDGHAVLLLQITQQIEDLRLHGDVKRGRRLIGDQQVRIVGKRHGNHHALALPAG